MDNRFDGQRRFLETMCAVLEAETPERNAAPWGHLLDVTGVSDTALADRIGAVRPFYDAIMDARTRAIEDYQGLAIRSGHAPDRIDIAAPASTVATLRARAAALADGPDEPRAVVVYKFTDDDLEAALNRVGIEVIALEDLTAIWDLPHRPIGVIQYHEICGYWVEFSGHHQSVSLDEVRTQADATIAAQQGSGWTPQTGDRERIIEALFDEAIANAFASGPDPETPARTVAPLPATRQHRSRGR
jgi:hypothetical protein